MNPKIYSVRYERGCVICNKELPFTSISNYHQSCVNENENHIHKSIKKCVVCKRTLPPKAIYDIHKKCVSESIEIKPEPPKIYPDKCIVQMYWKEDDPTECVLYV